MRYAFRIVNVFTVGDDKLSGNPLCVFEDARGLTDAQMQALARQFNLSETTFILPSSVADHRVRIFTPGFEMPFAGHPTLGTASVIGKDVAFEMLAGIVRVAHEGTDWTLTTARGPETRPVDATRDQLAAMVGLPPGSVTGEPLWVNTGVEQLVIPVGSAELVRAARGDRALLEKHGFSATRQEAMAYVWARTAASEGNADRILVRFFFTLDGSVIEDPATGSACANLGGWMVATNQALPVDVELRQGEQVGRPSRLRLRVAADKTIRVSGAAIELGRGTIEL